MEDVFPDPREPHKTPFILECFGFYFPYEEGETALNCKHINHSLIKPCPLPSDKFIGFCWEMTHFRNRQYDVVHLAEDAPPWKQKKGSGKKWLYPVSDTGESETWSFKNFKYLSNCADKRVMRLYRQILADAGPWWDLSLLLDEKFSAGKLEPNVKEEWEALQRQYSKKTKHLYWERKCVNDAILLAMAIDHRWGFPFMEEIFAVLGEPRLILVYMGFIVNILIDGTLDQTVETVAPLIQRKTALKKSGPTYLHHSPKHD